MSSKYYWMVRTVDAQVHLNATTALVEDGALVLRDDGGVVMFAFAPGQWLYVFAASQLDGSSVAVEHWKAVDKPASAKRKPKVT